MSGLTVTINGMSAALEHIHFTEKTLVNNVDAKIQKAGIACQKYAKKSCPVDKGRLRASILYRRVKKFEYEVSTNVNYSKFVEFGTRYMTARPFFYPAYYRSFQELMDDLRSVQVTE